MPGRPRVYASPAAKQAAYHQSKQWQALVDTQEPYAHQHAHALGRTPFLQSHATTEQRAIHAAVKERDMADCLWTLQTLIADFGYAAVWTHVLQFVVPPSP
jgi:hypothetical protein